MDGDGEITTEELRQAMTKLMGEHMAASEIDAIVKEADDNGDGTVDFEGQMTCIKNCASIIPDGKFRELCVVLVLVLVLLFSFCITFHIILLFCTCMHVQPKIAVWDQ
jgi:hypothetical protein